MQNTISDAMLYDAAVNAAYVEANRLVDMISNARLLPPEQVTRADVYEIQGVIVYLRRMRERLDIKFTNFCRQTL